MGSVDSFCKRHLIVLLFILSPNFVITFVNSVAGEQTPFAKLVTSYFKVPWINLNSSWADEVTSTCRNDVEMLYKSADAGEMWALKMLDSASKIPAGYLTGNIRDLGMYDQCIRVKGNENRANIQGRHCMISLSMPVKYFEDTSELLLIQKASIYNPTADVDVSLSTSLCFPSSCGVDDITGFVNASIQGTPEIAAFEVSIAEVTCSDDKIEDNLILGRILTTALLAMVAGILLFCTICDFVVRTRSNVTSPALKIAARFSLYTNAIKLSSTKQSAESMPAINGIRFLNTCLIVMGHRVLATLLVPFVNLSDAFELRQSVTSNIVHMTPYVVDTFFVMSGFLTASLFLKARHEGKKFNMLELYLHRYLRLTPCLAVLILFNIFYLPYLGSGPMWQTIIGITSGFCRKNWWTNLLYVQNFVNAEEMCMLHTWYLAVEMQLFWICPIILYPLFYRPKFGLAMLALFLIASILTPGVQLAVNQWAALFNTNKNIKVMYHEFFSSYPITYNRVLPYLIGILLGYDVVNNQRLFTKAQLVWNWILAGLLIIFSGWVTNFIQPNAPVFDVVWEVVYVTVSRLGWSIAMAWILYACTHGYGGSVTRFLSLPMFVPLSRMCYSIYLVHLVLQVGNNATVRTAAYNTPFSIAYLLWGDLAISIAIAFILTLCFESPIITLEKILRAKQSSPITKHISTIKKRELAAVIKEYLALTRGQAAADLAIERPMSQLNLCRNVSEVLNTSLVKGSMKAPAELTQVWEDWKSFFLRSENQKTTTGVEIVQIGCPEFQIGMPTLEKEFLIFLAGVSCGLGEAPGFTEAEFFGQKSQLDSCSWKNEDLSRLSTSISTPYAKQRSKFSGSTSTGIGYPSRRNGILP